MSSRIRRTSRRQNSISTYCHIVAPVTGRVGLRLVDPGNYVQTSNTTGLVVLAEVEPISVIFVIPEDAIQDVWDEVRAGQKLAVSAYNRSDDKLIGTGTLESVDNLIDTTTGTVKLRASFPNTDEKLFPNQFVNARLLVRTLDKATIAPVAAIQHGAPGTFVFLVKPDRFDRRSESPDGRHRRRSDPDHIRAEARRYGRDRRRRPASRRVEGPDRPGWRRHSRKRE